MGSWQSHVPSGGFRGNPLLRLFQFQGAIQIPGHLEPHHSDLCLHLHMFFCLWPSSLPLVRSACSQPPLSFMQATPVTSLSCPFHCPHSSKPEHVLHLRRALGWISTTLRLKPNFLRSWYGPLQYGPACLSSLSLSPSPSFTPATLILFHAPEAVKLFLLQNLCLYCPLFLGSSLPSGLRCLLLLMEIPYFLYYPLPSRSWPSFPIPTPLL